MIVTSDQGDTRGERMKVWTDKEGNKLSFKEFMGRWKKGIEGITPLQQAKSNFISGWIMVVGIVAGIVASLFNIKNFWWVIIILVAALINSIINQIAAWQRYKTYRSIDESLKEL